MQRPVLRAPVTALALCFAGCGGAATAPRAERASTPAAPQTERTPAPPEASPPETISVPDDQAQPEAEVVVQSSGDDAPAPLRYEPEPGQRQSLRLTLDMRLEISARGAVRGVQKTTIVMELDNEVTEVAADGSFRWRSRIRSIDVRSRNPRIERAARRMKPLVGFEAWMVCDARGRVLGTDFEPPDDLPRPGQYSMDALRDTMRSMLPPLPEQPVGPGADWRVTASREASGITFTEDSRYRLEERRDGRWTFALGLEAEGGRQRLPPPRPGWENEILSITSTGEGRLTVTEDGRLVHSEGNVESSSIGRLTGNGKQLDMRMDLSLDTRLEPL